MTRNLFEVDIDSLSLGGDGVGRYDGKVVFVAGGLPGDKVLARAEKVKKRFVKARLAKLLEPSPDRVESFCSHSKICGGCPLMALDYSKELEYKKSWIKESLARIGKINIDPEKIITAQEQKAYRSRISLRRTLDGADFPFGFSGKGNDTIVPIGNCPVADKSVNTALKEISAFAKENKSLIEPVQRVQIESCGTTGKARVILYCREKPDRSLGALLLCFAKSLKGVFIRFGNENISEGDVEIGFTLPVAGEMSLSATAFSQINRSANGLLVGKVLEYAGDAGGTLLDLYCGSGNYSIPLAMKGFDVTGVDISSADINSARRNAKRELAGSVAFLRDRAEEFVETTVCNGEKFTTMVLNPPRGGAKDVMAHVVKMRVKNIIYVSCDPPAFARDCALLSEAGYELSNVTPVDMFPKTGHVELVARLSLSREV